MLHSPSHLIEHVLNNYIHTDQFIGQLFLCIPTSILQGLAVLLFFTIRLKTNFCLWIFINHATIKCSIKISSDCDYTEAKKKTSEAKGSVPQDYLNPYGTLKSQVVPTYF